MKIISKCILAYVVLLILVTVVRSDCAFIVHDDLKPQPPQPGEQIPFHIDVSTCPLWNNQTGCCNANSFTQTTSSFRKIDTVFGGDKGGCDVCAVNLKRFWCEYSCSPRQADFVKVFDYEWVDSFEHPGEKVWVQRVELTVESTTACALFQSCKRTAYAAQVSAMQTPAGFLNFQGTNAIEDGAQTITILFTDDKDQGLYIPDLDKCDVDIKDNELKKFTNISMCQCNSCDLMCKGGEVYVPTPVMQGFNYVLVASVWGGAILLAGLVTGFRKCRKQKQQ